MCRNNKTKSPPIEAISGEINEVGLKRTNLLAIHIAEENRLHMFRCSVCGENVLKKRMWYVLRELRMPAGRHHA
ncbi:hypothetical protein TNCV_2552421 [Trichonephila clavipes]|nr:hypothetical protein TNCV_2552421 [Trichonephila clavipes]